jgi:hypothetical protein
MIRKRMYTTVPLHTIACIICRYNCIKEILAMVNGCCASCNCNCFSEEDLCWSMHAYIHTYMHERRSFECRILTTTTRKELRGTQLQTRRYTNKRTCLHTFKLFFLLSPPSYPQAFRNSRILTTHTENTKDFECF